MPSGLALAAAIRSLMVFHFESVPTATKKGVRNSEATGSKCCSVTKLRDLYRCGSAAMCSLSSCSSV